MPDKFDEIEQLLLHHRATLAHNTGVPFLRLVYDPQEEEACRHRRETLVRVLQGQGVAVETVSCQGAIFTHYEQTGRLDQLFEMEKRGDLAGGDRERLERNIGTHARKEMVGRLLQAAERLGGDGVILVVDVAFAYPYLSLAGVMYDVTNRIVPPAAVALFYPGAQSVDGELLLLGQRPSGTYRTQDLV